MGDIHIKKQSQVIRDCLLELEIMNEIINFVPGPNHLCVLLPWLLLNSIHDLYPAHVMPCHPTLLFHVVVPDPLKQNHVKKYSDVSHGLVSGFHDLNSAS
jgi:hypothetical protein